MARAKAKKTRNKLNVYFKTAADEGLVRRAAIILDCSIAYFMRKAIVGEAKRVIATHDEERKNLAAERQLSA